jgi:hypothetical protein
MPRPDDSCQKTAMQRSPAYPASRLRPAFVLFCLTACYLLAAGTTWGGTIKGTVRYTGAPFTPKKLPVTTDHYVCGASKDAEDLVLSPHNGIRNAVVSLQSPPPGTTWPAFIPIVQVDQEACVYIPHVVIVPVGGTVEFLNSDRLLHNLHSAGKKNSTFNRTQPRGRTIPIRFKKPEIVRLDCDLHPWMRAWIVVAEHPFYTVTNEQGSFMLDHVPAGDYTLRVWQEHLGIMTQDVSVTEDGNTIVSVEMSPQ